MWRFGLSFVVIGLALMPASAWACTVCSLGDDTPTSFGMGVPAASRVRLGVEGQWRTARYGETGVDRLDVSEQWLLVRGAWAFSDSAWLTLQLPLLRRSVAFPNLAEDIAYGWSDVELGGRWVVFRDRRFEPRHLLALRVGVELPTGLLRTDGTGVPLIIDQQLGSGGLDGRFGVDYAWLGRPVAVFASVTTQVSTAGFLGTRVGPAIVGAVTAQVRWLTELSTRVGVQSRYDGPLQLGDGRDDPHSGGFVASIQPAVIWQPSPTLFFAVGVEWPVVQMLRGEQFLGPTPYLEAVVDV